MPGVEGGLRLLAALAACGFVASAPCVAGEAEDAALAGPAPAAPPDKPAPTDGWDALRADLAAHASLALGTTASWTPSYSGSSSRKLQPSLLWAFQYGRVRISSGGGAAVLGIAQDPRGPGASAELFSNDDVRAGVALRIDRGRNSSTVDGLEDLPDVAATVRGRAYASYALTPHWTLAAAVAPDLLGRGGGTLATTDIGYRNALPPAGEWYAGAGVSWADARYMQSWYGVSEQSAAATGRTAYEPGAGATGLRLGIGFTAALTSRWIAYGGIGVTRLVGYAADSPLTQQRTAASASLGIAYRWGAKYEGLSSVLLPAPEQPR